MYVYVCVVLQNTSNYGVAVVDDSNDRIVILVTQRCRFIYRFNFQMLDELSKPRYHFISHLASIEIL